LFDAGVYDGYLLYDGSKPIGWCQCGLRDQLLKLRNEYKLESDPEVFAITCFVIIPSYREIGLGHFFLDEVLKDLNKRNVKYVQAFPRRGEKLHVEDLWTGPERFFEKAKFTLERDDPKYPIYGKRLK
jgi:ribosomal protein S18 acetylase RimI-like enzyme